MMSSKVRGGLDAPGLLPARFSGQVGAWTRRKRSAGRRPHPGTWPPLPGDSGPTTTPAGERTTPHSGGMRYPPGYADNRPRRGMVPRRQTQIAKGEPMTAILLSNRISLDIPADDMQAIQAALQTLQTK